MERRQKILMIILGCAALGVATVQFGPGLIAPFTKADRDLKAAKKELDRLTAVVSKKTELQEAYRALAIKTISLNPEQAAKDLHAIIQGVAESSKIHRPTINKAIIRPSKDPVTKALTTVVTVVVTGEGKVQDVVAFLDAFYRLPYMIYITELKLTPQPSRVGMTTTMKFEAKVETFVLQPSPMVGKRPVETANLDPKTRPKAERLAGKYLSSYSTIWSKNIFSPPPPPLASSPTPPPTPIPPRPGPVQPHRDTGRGATILVGVARYPWYDGNQAEATIIQEAITRNERTNEKRVIRVGEALDVGSLILVDASGAVVRTANREVYFYPLGKPLTESTRLDPSTQPDLYRTVQELDRQQQ